MEYYILSLIISFIIFAILQFIEYRKITYEINNNINNYYIEPYNLFHINNILLFVVIYLNIYHFPSKQFQKLKLIVVSIIYK